MKKEIKNQRIGHKVIADKTALMFGLTYKKSSDYIWSFNDKNGIYVGRVSTYPSVKKGKEKYVFEIDMPNEIALFIKDLYENEIKKKGRNKEITVSIFEQQKKEEYVVANDYGVNNSVEANNKERFLGGVAFKDLVLSGGIEVDRYIKEWYIKEFPNDECGDDIDDTITFSKLHFFLVSKNDRGKNVYDIIGVGDSVVRERVFQQLADMCGKEYDYIYHLWLYRE